MSDRIKNNWHWFFILSAIAIGLYIRLANPWNTVFPGWIDGAKLSGNDPWYYFRLIDSAVHNFPNRIWFDAFTRYPYGTYIHFGPFLVYLGALASLITGSTDPASIKSVIAFLPAIGGALLALPTYLLAKEVFNKKAGVIAALLVVLIPGQLMARSVLSFNDHHVWEVFWMTSVLALFTASINKWSGKNRDENIKDKKALMYPIMTGIALGLYLDTWAPGFIIALMIVIYAVIIYLFKKWLNAETESLTYIAIITFAVASLIYLPFAFNAPGFSTARYSPFQLLILVGSCLVILVFHLIERLESRGFFEKIGIREEYVFPATIVVSAGIIMGGVALLSPDFLFQLKSIIGVIQPKGGALTVAEVQPFFTMGGKFSLSPAWQNFSITFFFAIPAMIYYAYKLIKTRDERLLFILIWGFAMLVALAGQNRFAYYFGVVSAVFASAIISEILEKVKFYDYISAALNSDKKAMKKIGAKSLVAGVLLLFVLIYPTFSQANFYSKYSAGGINKQWYDTLVWMGENTPGKEVYDQFYYQLYKPPEDPREPYPYYPEGVYSIISWWDYGHWITAIAHRIPVANPFQQGIGNKYNDVPGAAPFFTAFNESYADRIADFFDVKYVVSDVEMATGKFYAMAVWAEGSLEKAGRQYFAGTGIVYVDPSGNLGLSLTGRLPFGAKRLATINIPSENYYRTMEAKFHIFDGSGLKHYRMVYESGPSRNSYPGFQELMYRKVYNSMYSNKLGYGKVQELSSGYVKVFEYVKGAVVKGKANGDEVVAKIMIKTNQGRMFQYTQKVKVIDGEYELVLPYAQNTDYPVKPASEYIIESGGISKKLVISEEQVQKGDVINLDLT